MNAIRNFIHGNRFAGLEAEILPDGIVLRLLILKRKGQQVSIDKSADQIASMEELEKLLPKNIPLAIAFTGKGILHRRITADPSADSRSFLAKALPNASPKDFYMQVASASQDELWVSLVRRSVADELIERLKEKQFALISASLGSLVLMNIHSLIPERENGIRSGKQFIRFEDDKISDLNYSEETEDQTEISIGGEKIKTVMLTAFALAFQQLFPVEKQITAETESLLSAKTEFRQRRIFQTGSKALLLVSLLVLLINFLFFSSYREKRNELDSQAQTGGGILEQVNQIESQVLVRKNFLEHAGLLGKAHYAYLADQLAAGLPEEILLTRMEIAPRLKLTEEDTIGFHPGEIQITGRCSKSIVLNQWIQEMKNKNWIRSAALKSYSQDKTMMQGTFELKLETE